MFLQKVIPMGSCVHVSLLHRTYVSKVMSCIMWKLCFVCAYCSCHHFSLGLNTNISSVAK